MPGQCQELNTPKEGNLHRKIVYAFGGGGGLKLDFKKTYKFYSRQCRSNNSRGCSGGSGGAGGGRGASRQAAALLSGPGH